MNTLLFHTERFLNSQRPQISYVHPKRFQTAKLFENLTRCSTSTFATLKINLSITNDKNRFILFTYQSTCSPFSHQQIAISTTTTVLQYVTSNTPLWHTNYSQKSAIQLYITTATAMSSLNAVRNVSVLKLVNTLWHIQCKNYSSCGSTTLAARRIS
jgi:hypothetical protein